MEANKMKAAQHLMALTESALERPIIDITAIKLAKGQDVSNFGIIQSDGYIQLTSIFSDHCVECGKYYEIEAMVYKNWGTDWVEGWFFGIDGDSNLFNEVEYATPQKAAQAMFEELQVRGYHRCDHF
jgi:hypothetical protein